MGEQMPLMVPGAAASDTPLEVYAPYNGDLIATLPTVGAEGVAQALNTAYGLYKNRDKWLSSE